MAYVDMKGNTYGLLTVTDRTNSGKWTCKCDCGNTCVVTREYLVSSDCPNCGCATRAYRADVAREKLATNSTVAFAFSSGGRRDSAKHYEYKGEMHTLREIETMTGISYSCLLSRIKERHCTAEEAVAIGQSRRQKPTKN